MRLTIGTRLRSAVDDTQLIVVRAPEDDLELTCGGHGLIELDAEPAPELTVLDGHDAGTLIGKRYADEESGLELLCTRAGSGSLHLDGMPLPVKSAKPLPSSD